MYSVLMLPKGEKLRKILDLAKTKDTSFSFVLENLDSVLNEAIIAEIQNYKLKSLSNSVVKLQELFPKTIKFSSDNMLPTSKDSPLEG